VSYIRNTVIRQNSKAKRQSPWKLILALLCISLVIACGTIQAVHVHPNGEISRADCPLCATAHVAIQIIQPPASLHVAPVVAIVETFLPVVPSRNILTFALFTRPPPVDVPTV
jgi:hypothetical protein